MKKLALVFAALLAAPNWCVAQGRPELIGGFFQGNVTVDGSFKVCTKDFNLGNCAAIAVIKAALAEFGSIDRIFTAYRRDNDTIRCTFRDGTVVALGPGERTVVTALADIRRGPATTLPDTAVILYGLISKRLWLRRSAFTPGPSFGNCVNSYRDAVQYLNSGYPTIHAPRLLALNSVEITDFSTLASTNSAIVYSKPHAAFSTLGQQDRFGSTYQINQKMRRGRPTGKWLMGTANGNTSPILGAYRLALP